MTSLSSQLPRQGKEAMADCKSVQPAMVSFTLPTPPSTNALFKNVHGKGRVKTGRYDDFIRQAVTAIRRQRVPSVEGEVVIIMGVERPNKTSDIDNRLKGAIDSIVKAGVITDDNLVTAIAVSWLPPANGLTHVFLMPVKQFGIQFHPAKSGASGSWIIAPSIKDIENEIE